MHQQREAYYGRMSELSYDERTRLNERIKIRRRQQKRKMVCQKFDISQRGLTNRFLVWLDFPAGMQRIDLFQPHKCNYYNVGDMTYKCHHCQALGFDGENRSKKNSMRYYGIMCCNQGKVIMDSIPTPPPEMLSLWSESTQEAQFFRDHIRAINTQLNFGSLQVIEKTKQGWGSASFKV